MGLPLEVYLIDLIRVAFALGFILALAGPLTWAERRQAAMIQDRVGPNRASIRLFGREWRAIGLFHPIADVIKLLTKEDTIHERVVDRFLFNLAPVLALFPALVTFAVIPFGPIVHWNGVAYPLQAVHIEAGMLYIFAVSSLAVFGTTLAGYTSGNKFAMLGGLRAAAQMISYEVTLGLSLVGIFMVFGSLEPMDIVYGQGQLLWGWLPKWGLFVQPIGFLIFFTSAMAENKRTPFDTVEGESEIIGYFLEYSGMKFGMFYMAEYVEVIVIAGVVTTLFLGGWQIPYLHETGFIFPWRATVPIRTWWLIPVFQMLAFVMKVLFVCWFQMMLRWSLPRFRYDQVMSLGWRILLPLALVNVVITAIVILW